MNRCVAIHSNGTSEVIDVQPRVHRELRGLGYRRFVIRTADGRSPLTSAIYARAVPSTWQIGDAARKLWGRNTTAVHVFDEDGEPLAHDGSPGMTTGEMRVIDAPITERPTPPAATPAQPTSARASTPASSMPASVDGAPPPPTSPVTKEMLDDLRAGAREIRGLLASRPVGLEQANELRALADRLEVWARMLEPLRVERRF
jgi:hypothetical protein